MTGAYDTLFGSDFRYRAFTAVKYLTYVLLSFNVYLFLQEELAARLDQADRQSAWPMIDRPSAQAWLEMLEQLMATQRPDSCRGQLDSERQAVETAYPRSRPDFNSRHTVRSLTRTSLATSCTVKTWRLALAMSSHWPIRIPHVKK